MKLSENFTYEELTVSQTAVRLGIDNTPNVTALANLKRVAATLEAIRAYLGKPITVSSGYRSPEVNLAVGGAKNSAHLTGLAADITVKGMTCTELAKAIIASGVDFDQCIFEGTWVHIGLADGVQRRQVLTAHFANGQATYSAGIA